MAKQPLAKAGRLFCCAQSITVIYREICEKFRKASQLSYAKSIILYIMIPVPGVFARDICIKRDTGAQDTPLYKRERGPDNESL